MVFSCSCCSYFLNFDNYYILKYLYRYKKKEIFQNVKNTKLEIQKGLRQLLGVIVDQPKPGSGNTNNGNLARRFFKNIDKVTAVTAQERGEEAPPPPLIEGRGDPPPSPEPNIRRAPPEQEPFALRQPNEQDLPLQQQDFPLVDQDIAPQQNLQQNNLQQQDFPLVDQNIAPQQDLRQNNLQQQDFPLVDQDIAPQQDLQQNPQLNMDARFPPTLQSWEAFSQALFSIQPTLPEYTGLDYEDPDRYLTKCQEYVTTLQIPNANKVSVLEKGLKGAAEKWWLCYKPMNLSFERFSDQTPDYDHHRHSLYHHFNQQKKLLTTSLHRAYSNRATCTGDPLDQR
uniref:Retrotransposon gag domain-containing protein n=1 Tax=Trichogramma kaykai TaxID=54128 RepID=A0ABD2X6X6_9HYME